MAPGHPSQRVERVGGHREPALVVDQPDGLARVVVAGAERAAHVVVVGDADDVESPGGGPHDRLRRLPAFAVEGVYVEVRAPAARRVPPVHDVLHHDRACTRGIDHIPFAP
jgi:hypothetical protein